MTKPRILVRKPEVKRTFRRSSVYERIALKWILRNRIAGCGFTWFRIWTSGGLL
jgi:hypothetical protein